MAGLVLNDETADEAHAFGYGYGYYGKSYGHREVGEAVRRAQAEASGTTADDAATNGNGSYPELNAEPPVNRVSNGAPAAGVSEPGQAGHPEDH